MTIPCRSATAIGSIPANGSSRSMKEGSVTSERVTSADQFIADALEWFGDPNPSDGAIGVSIDTVGQIESHLITGNYDGFLGVESARSKLGITISYWKSLASIKNWKKDSEHAIAQKKGKELWYQSYRVRICKVEREYSFKSKE